MMKFPKKSVSLLLVLLLTLGSCGPAPQTNETETEASVPSSEIETTEETELTPSLPEELNFNGEDFALLSGQYNEYCPVTREDANGEVLNDAIYWMELNTEERLNVKITENRDNYVDIANNMAIALVTAGDTTYHAMNQLDRFSIDLMVGGYLRPLEDAEYMDRTRSWWNPDITE